MLKKDEEEIDRKRILKDLEKQQKRELEQKLRDDEKIKQRDQQNEDQLRRLEEFQRTA